MKKNTISINLNLNINKITVEEAKKLIKTLQDGIKEVEEVEEVEDGKQEKIGKELTYDYIMRFFYEENQRVFYPIVLNMGEGVGTFDTKECKEEYSYRDWYNCLSEAQAKRIQAYAKLQNIAKYLNDAEWKPDYDYISYPAFVINYNPLLSEPYYPMRSYCNEGSIAFQSFSKVRLAIKLMGEESLGDLFNTNW